MKIRFVLTRDENVPTGGVKQAYRQVDVLRKHGYDAAIVTPVEGFRCSWFENDTFVVGPGEQVGPGDFVVLSEVLPFVPPEIKGAEEANIIVYAQNPFNVPRGFGGISNFGKFYKDKVRGVMCVSQHSLEQLSALLPETEVHRIRYSFDRAPWGLSRSPKEKRILYMPRKRGRDIEEALMLVNQAGLLRGWHVDTVDGKSESEVAELMRRAMVFISGSFREGFGMPPAEAMACGCVVVGWTGIAGREFMLPGVAYPVPEGDVLHCANTLKEVLSQPVDKLIATGEMASEYIRNTYSSTEEEKSVLEAWKAFTGTAVFPLKDVAAFVSTYDEGPYLESVLRWLSPRVGMIYVVESLTTFHGEQKPEGERLTKKIVDSVRGEGLENISYHVLEGKSHPKPDIKEAHERNQALEMIERDGYKWVWIVDADEFYTDDEAEKLWAWFLDVSSRHPEVCGAKCTWYTYWRSLKWRIDPPENFHPNIIVKPSCRIATSRHLVPEQQSRIMDVPRDICMARHYSWAHTPEYVQRKLATWTHAHQVVPDWFRRVFMAWKPGSDMRNLNPSEPTAYQEVVRASEPMPEALASHPYMRAEIIESPNRKRIKVVILNHNMPENCDRLYEQLSGCFDDVEIFDSGSDPDKIPIHMGRRLPNVYWTGGWNEILKTCSGYDAVWMLGDDIELRSSPEDYRDAIESSLPFGCWSPCIEGRAKPFMQAAHYAHGEPKSVRNMEGMAMALSGEMMRSVKRLPEGSNGYGQDLWLCFKAREAGLRNVVDGRVRVFHPEGIRYDDESFHKQMEAVFGKMFGPDFRRTVFQYDDRYERNLMEENTMSEKPRGQDKPVGKPYTIVTVDNGWSYPDYIRITNAFPEARKIIMTKGVAEIPPHKGIEIVPYDGSLSMFLVEADVALFPKVGVTTKEDLLKLMKAGVPCVVHQDFAKDIIEHMENGYIYQVLPWAQRWLEQIRDDPKLRDKIASYRWPDSDSQEEKESEPVVEVVKEEVSDSQPAETTLVTVITPTWSRDLKIIKRCIDAVRLQTEQNWEQLVCSNGPEEPQVKQLVEGLRDPRVKYRCVGKDISDKDFGNSARKAMIGEAWGEFVAFCDDDNIYLPGFLETMTVKLVNEPDAGFAVCDIMHFGPLNEAEVGSPPIVLKGEPVKLYHIDPLQVMVRKSVMREVGWDTEVGYLSDGVTLEKLGRGHEHIKVNELLGVHL